MNLIFYARLFSNKDKFFLKAYRKRYEELSPTIYNAIISYLEDFEASDTGKALDEARTYDYSRWYGYLTLGGTVSEDVDAAVKWFTARKLWLDENVAELDTTTATTGISNTESLRQTAPSAVYNLSGIKVPAQTKGILISNHRKYLQK